MTTQTHSLEVAVPAEHAYRWWRGLTNLPSLLPDVLSVEMADNPQLTRWEVRDTAGATLQVMAKITEDIPNEKIAWLSADGAAAGLPAEEDPLAFGLPIRDFDAAALACQGEQAGQRLLARLELGRFRSEGFGEEGACPGLVARSDHLQQPPRHRFGGPLGGRRRGRGGRLGGRWGRGGLGGERDAGCDSHEHETSSCQVY